jgi:uncharacterized membrane protein YkvI
MNHRHMKHVKFTLIVFLLSFGLFFSAAAAAPAGQADTLPINTGIVALLVIGLVIGIRVVLKKLKQVDKDLHDAFGEKIL